MTTVEDLRTLLARVEAASESDREIDLAIHRVTDHGLPSGWIGNFPNWYSIPRYTTSLDGIPHCLRLVRDELPAWRIELSICPDDAEERRCGCYLSPPDARYDEDRLWHETYTLPLAILAALLRALIAEAENAA